MTATSRPCPVCGSLSRTLVFEQRFERVAGSPITGYDVVACRDCGMTFADGIPDQETLAAHYREMSSYEYGQREGRESDHDRARLEIVARDFERFIPSRDLRVLDVGCASGRLPAWLKEHGHTQVMGVDPSPACAAAARRLYGIEVVTGTVQDCGLPELSFGAISMIGVLEHMVDVRDALDGVARLLAPGGILYLEVPDATRFADFPNAPFQDFSTEHINFFGPVSLDNLMGRHGFTRVEQVRNARVQSHASVMSNISAAYRLDGTRTRPLTHDLESEAGLVRYVASCRAEEARIARAIADLVDSRAPLIVWGVGTHTSRLLATSRLAEARIVAFIDSNVHYQNKELIGRPVLPPTALRTRGERVLVSSRPFQAEIAEQIRAMGCANELILLYPTVPSDGRADAARAAT
jgi:SAM-dependent methyltransferase